MPLIVSNKNNTSGKLQFSNLGNGGMFSVKPTNVQGQLPLYVTSNLILNLDANAYSGTGAWLDSTPNGNNATSVQSPTYSSSSGSYFDFDGGSITATGQVDSFAILDSSTLDNIASMSIEMWINTDSIQGTTNPNLLFSKRDTTSNGYIGFFTSTGYVFRFGTASPTQLTWTTTPITGSWQQIVVTVGSGSGGRIYRNGSLVQSSSYTGSFNNLNTNANLLIGDVNPNATGINGYDGKIGIIRVYDRVLSSTDVVQNYDSTKNRYLRGESYVSSSLMLHLDAGNPSSYGGTGEIWYDLTGNSRNATLVNSPSYDNITAGGLFSFDDLQFEYATINDIGDLNVFSIEVWCRVHKSLTGKVTAVLTNQFDLVNKLNFSIGTNRAPTSYNMSFGYFNGAWRNVNGFAASLNTWYHLVGTYDGSTLKFYKNGALDTQLAYSGTPQTGGQIRLARRWDEAANNSSNFFDGDISIVRIYNSPLSSTDVLQNYDSQKYRFGL